jgi:hypothetical protein
MRLLSFLTDIEHALIADDPAPLGGAWDNTRTVNYQQGLARLILGAQRPGEPTLALGGVTLQEFRLADGSTCIKAFLAWKGTPDETSHAIYETPDTLWSTEARRIGATWLAGREKYAEAESDPAVHAQAAG